MGSASRELLEKRCRRALASVLATKDLADAYLPPEMQALLRKVILDQFNDFTSLAGDIVDSLERDSVVNELWLAKLEEMHADVTRLRERLGG